ncbi:hypothetical protein ACSNOI_43920 [Actinomadura kijaniata]|uniref:hypothetical protein n=1 Tax=Actinomadura kijaniata TaxID=46161 RepID=UPI003F1A0509
MHELDLIDPCGRGERSRRHCGIAAVGQRCDRALHLVYDSIKPTAAAVKACTEARPPQPGPDPEPE